MQLLVELSTRKIYVLDFNTRGNLQTRIANTKFCELHQNGDKDFNIYKFFKKVFALSVGLKIGWLYPL